MATEFHWAFEGVGDTMDHYMELYGDLYGQEPTRLEGNIEGEAKPLIYTLKLPVKGPLGVREKAFTFVFFDPTGEDLQEFYNTDSTDDTVDMLSWYISNSTGIIFLVDPLKIPAIKAQLDENEVERVSSGDWYRPDEMLTKVSDLIRRPLEPGKIGVPVSVVLSKLDVIEPVIPQGSTILKTSPHGEKGAFDLTDGQNVDAEVRGLLQAWGMGSFLKQLKMNYMNYSCFAVSALGMHNNPDGNGRINCPHPHRIEDPLLWIIMKQKIIKARKN